MQKQRQSMFSHCRMILMLNLYQKVTIDLYLFLHVLVYPSEFNEVNDMINVFKKQTPFALCAWLFIPYLSSNQVVGEITVYRFYSALFASWFALVPFCFASLPSLIGNRLVIYLRNAQQTKAQATVDIIISGLLPTTSLTPLKIKIK